MNYKLLAALIAFSGMFTAFTLKKNKPLHKLPKEYREKFGFIPNLVYTLLPEFPEIKLGCQRDSSQTVSLSSFYCSTTEVSNLEYRTFLKSLKDTSILQIAQLDTLQWRANSMYNEPYVELYHAHPAYDSYPVVNVPYRGALMYCQWLEEKLNSYEENTYHFHVSLPTRKQWVAAANGRLDLSPYPWGGPYLKNIKGCALANYNYIGAESIHYNDSTQQYEIMSVMGAAFYNGSGCGGYADITAPVVSYFANDYNLYNMSGNVAEMVLEEGVACGGGWRSSGYDIRCVSTMNYTSPQSDIGFRPVIRIEKK